MTITPWGDSETLRERRLSPGPGTSRQEVERNQRERLFAATVAVTTAKGYANSSVTDIIELAGVSSSSFYQHFSGKEECFLATQAEILAEAQADIAQCLENGGPWQERVRRAADAIVSRLVDQPAAARLCLVESYAVGPAATAPIDQTTEAAISALRRCAENRGGTAMPGAIVKAIAGGFLKLGHTYLHRGAERALVDVAPALLELALSYRAPPVALKERARPAGLRTASPASIDRRTDPAERIVRATMRVIADKGYQATTMADIAEAASVSLSTLYANFDGKADAFDAALYSGRARLLGVALPAYRMAKSWPEAICATIRATLGFLEAEPDFARLIAFDVYAAGPQALEGRDRAIGAAQRLIEEGVDAYAPDMPPVWCEAITNFLYALLCERMRTHGAENLRGIESQAAYLALAPFLGPERACDFANERRRVTTRARREEGERS